MQPTHDCRVVKVATTLVAKYCAWYVVMPAAGAFAHLHSQPGHPLQIGSGSGLSRHERILQELSYHASYARKGASVLHSEAIRACPEDQINRRIGASSSALNACMNCAPSAPSVTR